MAACVDLSAPQSEPTIVTLAVHPFALLRSGGLPVSCANLSSGQALAHLRAERTLAAELSTRSSLVCDALANHVPEMFARDQALGRALVQLKRDLFNGRLPEPRAQRTMALLPPPLGEEITAFVDLIVKRRELVDSWEQVHAEELEDGLRRADAALAHPNLREGLAITNPALFRKLLDPTARARLSRKDLRNARFSAARYVLRSARKTSPLASLGVVALAGLDGAAPLGQMPLAELPSDFERRRAPRLAAVQYVFDQLLRFWPAIGDAAPIVLNGSLSLSATGASWITIDPNDPPQAQSRATRITRNRSDGSLVKLLAAILGTAAARTAGELRVLLAERLGSDGTSRAETLLAGAWRHGLILADLPDRDDFERWWPAACGCLKPEQRDAMLQSLGAFVGASASSWDGEAATVSPQDVERCFAHVLDTAGLDVPASAFGALVFDDCVVPAGRVALPASVFDEIGPDLVAYLRIARLLSADAPLPRMRRTLTRAFVSRFGSGGRCTDVPGFLEAMAAVIDFETGNLVSPSGEVVPARDSADEAVMRLRDALVESLASPVGEAPVVNVDPELFEQFRARMPLHLRRQALSASAFGHIMTGPSGPQFILNRLYPGTGRMTSRFLSDADGSAAKVEAYLRRATPSSRLLELPGAFGFNASLHPRLAREALRMPPFPPAHGRASVDLAELVLRHDPEHDDLLFCDANGNEADIAYLGLVAPPWLPRWHQLLYAMSFGGDRADGLWPFLLRRLGTGQECVSLPRMQVGALVFVRATTAVRRSVLPATDLTPSTFFRYLQGWAETQKLSRNLFFQLSRIPGAGSGHTRPGRADAIGAPSKPMPLDLDCPLSVALFQRSLARSDLGVVLAEALPGPGDASFTRDGEAVATEVCVEVTVGS